MKNIVFPYYKGNIYEPFVEGYVSLDRFIDAHSDPTDTTWKLLSIINDAAINKDKTLKNNLKKQLHYFTPAVVIKIGTARRYENIIRFTGLVQIDIDGIELQDAKDLKVYLFDNYKEFFCLYLSPSGMGVKGLIRIPIVKSVKEYKEYFQGIEDEFDWIHGWDSAPKNPVLPLYISADRKILRRDNATVWTKKGELPDITTYENLTDKIPIRASIDGDSSVYKSKSYYEKITLDIFKKRIDAIVDSDGHMRMRSACLVLGSRVGAGYISLGDADFFAEQVIRGNAYLNKGIENYLKTMNWGITQGIKNPKYYE